MTDSEKTRILVVDDEPATCSFMKILLEMEGYQVETASDVASAQEHAAANPPDLAITDLRLPDGSGIDLARSLQAGKKIPCFAISGLSIHELSDEDRTVFAEYLTKPVEFPALKIAVRKWTSKT